MFVEYGMIGHYWDDFFSRPSMYEVGRYFLSHKAVVRRIKNKRRKKRR